MVISWSISWFPDDFWVPIFQEATKASRNTKVQRKTLQLLQQR
jgi:hypothetical protein